MNSLVKSTFDQLTSRLKRAGTLVKSTPVGSLAPDSLQFRVVKDGANSQDDSYADVSVSLWHQNNVYITPCDKVQIIITNSGGQLTRVAFLPRTGSCPPLDKVESKIRDILETRILASKNNVHAARQESERLAELECPLPDGVSIIRNRCSDGTYDVKMSCHGMTSRGVNQLVQIIQASDAIQLSLPDPPAPLVSVSVPIDPPRQPKSRFYAKRNAVSSPVDTSE